MGTVMKADNSSCIVPPPTTPTPRPIPTMAAEVKSVTGGLSKGASTLIIIFLSITLLLFLIFRIFTPSRGQILHLSLQDCLDILLWPSLIIISLNVVSIKSDFFG